MKYVAVAAGLVLIMVGACETGVKPTESAARPASRQSSDQSPDLDPHPRALATGQPSVAQPVPPEYAKITKKYFDQTKARANEPPDGFAATVNHYCPVMQKNTVNAQTPIERTVEFEGKMVGFCCDDCRDAWNSLTDDERRAMLTAALNKKK